jgi:2-methylisocitrate lyase-like PEP mutase family enzyme
MSADDLAATLRARLADDGALVLAPGVYDAFAAMMAERAGFEALYVSGASIAYTRLGRPDIGLVSVTEVAEAIALIRERVALPLIVDADTGFGNALNLQRTVRLFERAGATALQIEDQVTPKRCGHLDGKALVGAGEMVGKIKAFRDAATVSGTILIARTDAIAVEGLEAALDRAESYLEAGADVLFVEAPRSDAEMQAVINRFRGRVPLMANMVEGGKTPLRSAEELRRIGYRLAIFPGGLARAVAATMQAYFASLKTHGTTAPFQDRMLSFAELNALLGTADILEAAQAYDEDRNQNG